MSPATKRTTLLLSIGWLFLVLSFTAPAQIGGGSLVGNVMDPSGAVVPNATVKATNTATNVVSSATTNGQGYYEFPLLPAGRYLVEVSAAGFEPRRSNPFDLNTGTRPRFDFTLKVGGITI